MKIELVIPESGKFDDSRLKVQCQTRICNSELLKLPGSEFPVQPFFKLFSKSEYFFTRQKYPTLYQFDRQYFDDAVPLPTEEERWIWSAGDSL